MTFVNVLQGKMLKDVSINQDADEHMNSMPVIAPCMF